MLCLECISFSTMKRYLDVTVRFVFCIVDLQGFLIDGC